MPTEEEIPFGDLEDKEISCPLRYCGAIEANLFPIKKKDFYNSKVFLEYVVSFRTQKEFGRSDTNSFSSCDCVLDKYGFFGVLFTPTIVVTGLLSHNP